MTATPNHTADPYGAQAHARAMADIRVDAMPTVPPATGYLWQEVIAPGGYASRRIAAGTRVTLTDLAGDACASLLLFNSECTVERLNVADTMKVQWNAYLGAGRLLLSDMGRVLASLVEDTAATHDAICGAANAACHQRKYGESGNHGPFPDARSRFLVALGKVGLGRKDVHPCVNFFKGVRVAPDGGTQAQLGPFAPGRALTLRAEMDLILVLANCPHVLDERDGYRVTALGVSAAPGAVAAADDAIRNASPEAQRAFLNTEDYRRR